MKLNISRKFQAAPKIYHKWWFFQFFAIYLKNAFYLANIFQFDKYSYFLLMCVLYAKDNKAVDKQNDPQKVLLRSFRYFRFYNITMTCQKFY